MFTAGLIGRVNNEKDRNRLLYALEERGMRIDEVHDAIVVANKLGGKMTSKIKPEKQAAAKDVTDEDVDKHLEKFLSDPRSYEVEVLMGRNAKKVLESFDMTAKMLPLLSVPRRIRRFTSSGLGILRWKSELTTKTWT